MKLFFQREASLMRRSLSAALFLPTSPQPCLSSPNFSSSRQLSFSGKFSSTAISSFHNSLSARGCACGCGMKGVCLKRAGGARYGQPKSVSFSTEAEAEADEADAEEEVEDPRKWGSNLYEVVADLPIEDVIVGENGKKKWKNKNGRGLRFARKIWKYRYPEPCYWTITKFKPRDEHKHKAKAWGILTWRGVPAHKPTLIRGSRKRQWELFPVQAHEDGKYVFATGPDPSIAIKQKRLERKEVRKAIEQEVKAVWDAKVKALQDAREEKARILADEEEAARKAGEEAQRRVSEGQKKIKKLELIRRSAQDGARLGVTAT